MVEPDDSESEMNEPGGSEKETKGKAIQIRVSEAEKAILQAAAKRARRSLSSWVLIVCLREARKTDGDSET